MSSAAVSHGHHPAAFEPPEHERPDALRVPRGVQGGSSMNTKQIGSAQSWEHLERRRLQGVVRVAGEQRGDDRGVGGVAAAQLAIHLRVALVDELRATRPCW